MPHQTKQPDLLLKQKDTGRVSMKQFTATVMKQQKETTKNDVEQFLVLQLERKWKIRVA